MEIGIVLLILVALGFALWWFWPRKYRAFEATRKRADAIMKKTGGNIGSFSDYRSVTGGDASEYTIVKSLASNGQLSASAINTNLSSFDSYYARGFAP